MKRLVTAMIIGTMTLGIVGCSSANKDTVTKSTLNSNTTVEESAGEIKEVSAQIEPAEYEGNFIAGLIEKPCQEHEGGIIVKGLFGLEGEVCITTDDNTVYHQGAKPEEYPKGYILSGYYTGEETRDAKEILLSTLLAVEEDQVIEIDDPIETDASIEAEAAPKAGISTEVSAEVEATEGELVIGVIKKPCEDHKGGIIVDGIFGTTGDLCLIIDENTVFKNGKPEEYPEGYLISGFYTGKVIEGDVPQITLTTLSAVEPNQEIKLDDPVMESGTGEMSIQITE